jgi:hypothetical protein
MTNIIDLLHVSLAYKAVALQLMVGEANFYADKLHLAEAHPIQVSQVTEAHFGPPKDGFGIGSFSTTNYFYSFPGSEGRGKQSTNPDGTIFLFPEKGKLAYISKNDPYKAFGGDYFSPKLANAHSLIGTNEAYQLAKQWLTAISIDVVALEKKYKPLVEQDWYLDPPLAYQNYRDIPKDFFKNAHKKFRPIFTVTWGGKEDDSPPVLIKILGTSKELISLRMQDTTLSKRPPIVITNAVELNNRPDPATKRLQAPTKSGSSP